MFFKPLLFLTLSVIPLFSQRLQPPTTLDVQDNGAGSYVVSWEAMNLRPYQIETSLDLVTWLPLGDTIIGDGSEVQMLVQSDTDQLFFRHREGAVRPFVTSGSVLGIHDGSSVTLDGIIAPNDDGSSHIVGGNPAIREDHAAVCIGFPINLFNEVFEHVFVNNNGNITFEAGLVRFTPQPLDDAEFDDGDGDQINIFDSVNNGRPFFAPLWADVQTSPITDRSFPDTINSTPVSYGPGVADGRPAFFVNWEDVGYFGGTENPLGGPSIPRTNRLNHFQIVIIQREDTGSPQNFDVEYNYNQIDWDAGTFSGGRFGIGSGTFRGLGGRSIRVGLTNGEDCTVEFANSGTPRLFLDNQDVSEFNRPEDDSDPNFANGLIYNSHNSNIPGRYVFEFRSGELVEGINVHIEEPVSLPVSPEQQIFMGVPFEETQIWQLQGSINARDGANFVFSWDIVQSETGVLDMEGEDTLSPTVRFPFGGAFFTAELTATLVDDPNITFVDYVRVGPGRPLLSR